MSPNPPSFLPLSPPPPLPLQLPHVQCAANHPLPVSFCEILLCSFVECCEVFITLCIYIYIYSLLCTVWCVVVSCSFVQYPCNVVAVFFTSSFHFSSMLNSPLCFSSILTMLCSWISFRSSLINRCKFSKSQLFWRSIGQRQW